MKPSLRMERYLRLKANGDEWSCRWIAILFRWLDFSVVELGKVMAYCR